jgi:hypothetical protein
MSQDCTGKAPVFYPNERQECKHFDGFMTAGRDNAAFGASEAADSAEHWDVHPSLDYFIPGSAHMDCGGNDAALDGVSRLPHIARRYSVVGRPTQRKTRCPQTHRSFLRQSIEVMIVVFRRVFRQPLRLPDNRRQPLREGSAHRLPFIRGNLNAHPRPILQVRRFVQDGNTPLNMAYVSHLLNSQRSHSDYSMNAPDVPALSHGNRGNEMARRMLCPLAVPVVAWSPDHATLATEGLLFSGLFS